MPFPIDDTTAGQKNVTAIPANRLAAPSDIPAESATVDATLAAVCARLGQHRADRLAQGNRRGGIGRAHTRGGQRRKERIAGWICLRRSPQCHRSRNQSRRQCGHANRLGVFALHRGIVKATAAIDLKTHVNYAVPRAKTT